MNSGGVKFAVYHFLITSYVAIGLGRRFRAEAWRQANIKGGVEQELTGRESEPSKLIYFKVYKSQIPVIKQEIETTALIVIPFLRLYQYLSSSNFRGQTARNDTADFASGQLQFASSSTFAMSACSCSSVSNRLRRLESFADMVSVH